MLLDYGKFGFIGIMLHLITWVIPINITWLSAYTPLCIPVLIIWLCHMRYPNRYLASMIAGYFLSFCIWGLFSEQCDTNFLCLLDNVEELFNGKLQFVYFIKKDSCSKCSLPFFMLCMITYIIFYLITCIPKIIMKFKTCILKTIRKLKKRNNKQGSSDEEGNNNANKDASYISNYGLDPDKWSNELVLKDLYHTISLSHYTCTFAVIGEWGCGKSSFIKALLNEFRAIEKTKDYIFLEFDLFEYENYAKDVKLSVLSVLKKQLVYYLKEKRLDWVQIDNLFDQYTKALQFDVHINIPHLNIKPHSFSDCFYNPINKIKENLKRELKKLLNDDKIIIIYDDLDRMSYEEIMIILKAINNFHELNSSNIIQIVSYCEQSLKDIFQEKKQKLNYLDKMIRMKKYLRKLPSMEALIREAFTRVIYHVQEPYTTKYKDYLLKDKLGKDNSKEPKMWLENLSQGLKTEAEFFKLCSISNFRTEKIVQDYICKELLVLGESNIEKSSLEYYDITLLIMIAISKAFLHPQFYDSAYACLKVKMEVEMILPAIYKQMLEKEKEEEEKKVQKQSTFNFQHFSKYNAPVSEDKKNDNVDTKKNDDVLPTPQHIEKIKKRCLDYEYELRFFKQLADVDIRISLEHYFLNFLQKAEKGVKETHLFEKEDNIKAMKEILDRERERPWKVIFTKGNSEDIEKFVTIIAELQNNEENHKNAHQYSDILALHIKEFQDSPNKEILERILKKYKYTFFTYYFCSKLIGLLNNNPHHRPFIEYIRDHIIDEELFSKDSKDGKEVLKIINEEEFIKNAINQDFLCSNEKELEDFTNTNSKNNPMFLSMLLHTFRAMRDKKFIDKEKLEQYDECLANTLMPKKGFVKSWILFWEEELRNILFLEDMTKPAGESMREHSSDSEKYLEALYIENYFAKKSKEEKEKTLERYKNDRVLREDFPQFMDALADKDNKVITDALKEIMSPKNRTNTRKYIGSPFLLHLITERSEEYIKSLGEDLTNTGL